MAKWDRGLPLGAGSVFGRVFGWDLLEVVGFPLAILGRSSCTGVKLETPFMRGIPVVFAGPVPAPKGVHVAAIALESKGEATF